MKRLFFVVYFLFFAVCLNAQWYPVGGKLNSSVFALDSLNGKLYVGGAFDTAGGIHARQIASWNGTSWDSLGSGVNSEGVSVLGNYNNNLYAGGVFTTAGSKPTNYIAEWDGTNWYPLGEGVRGYASYVGSVDALTTYNSELIVGGQFDTAGSVIAYDIAAWNGTSWSDVGGGFDTNSVVGALTTYNGNLIAGGIFTEAGGVPARNIAEWNGTSWAPLGSGVNGSVGAFTIYNGTLIVSGSFDSAGGKKVNYIAQWNGTSWSPIGIGMSNTVADVFVYNDTLIACGFFDTAGGNIVHNIAKWDGISWQSMDQGFHWYGFALTSYDGILFAGGNFDSSGGQPISWIAEYGGAAGVNEISNKDEQVKVYPNPSDGKFTIESSVVSGQSSVKIYNMLGQQIANSQWPSASSLMQIDISNEPAGIYLYRIVSYNGELIAGGKLTVIR